MTPMSSISYYGEEGLFHSHDPNIRTRSYTCTNHHTWLEKSKATRCINCSYGHEK